MILSPKMARYQRQTSRLSYSYDEENVHHAIIIPQNHPLPLELHSLSMFHQRASPEVRMPDQNPANGMEFHHTTGQKPANGMDFNPTNGVGSGPQSVLYETIFGFTYTAAMGLLTLPQVNEICKDNPRCAARLVICKISVVISCCAALVAIMIRRRWPSITRLVGGVAIVSAAMALVSLSSLVLPFKLRHGYKTYILIGLTELGDITLVARLATQPVNGKSASLSVAAGALGFRLQ